MSIPGDILKNKIFESLKDYFNTNDYENELRSRLSEGFYKDDTATEPEDRFSDEWFGLYEKLLEAGEISDASEVDDMIDQYIGDSVVDSAVQSMVNLGDDMSNAGEGVFDFVENNISSAMRTVLPWDGYGDAQTTLNNDCPARHFTSTSHEWTFSVPLPNNRDHFSDVRLRVWYNPPVSALQGMVIEYIAANEGESIPANSSTINIDLSDTTNMNTKVVTLSDVSEYDLLWVKFRDVNTRVGDPSLYFYKVDVFYD